MVFLCWNRPSPQEQKACLERSGSFNYGSKYKGFTSKAVSQLKEDKELLEDGFFINHARILIGSGVDTYEKGKVALKNWRNFSFDWAFVDPATPIQNGVKFCVCAKNFLLWTVMPLEIVSVDERRNDKKAIASFGFSSGTLHGHLLAGEERFSIELDDNDQVWYEVLSFSKPGHFLSVLGYPYVLSMQKRFARLSTDAVLKMCHPKNLT